MRGRSVTALGVALNSASRSSVAEGIRLGRLRPESELEPAEDPYSDGMCVLFKETW